MPTAIEIRTRSLLLAAEETKATAAANLLSASAAADAAYSAISAAVKSAGFDSFETTGGQVSVPARLRNWSAVCGVSPPSRVGIGLEPLVTAFNAANAAATRRQHEVDGLNYLITQASGILLQGTDYESPTTASDLNSLLQMLASIQTSMAA